MKPPSPLLSLLLLLVAGLASPAEPFPPPGAPAEVLPSIRVKGEVQCSFGFGVTMLRHPQTMQVARLFVGKMDRKSPVVKLGLRPGDEILSLDGKKVRGMNGEAKQGGELFTLLCNRAAGDTLEIEAVVQDRVQRLTLTAHKSARGNKARDN